jgi:multiple sugar transport system substrate-binding protein
MKWKKLISVLLVGAMVGSLAACGDSSSSANGGGSSTESGSSTSASGEKLVIWTLANDLKDFADRYTEQTGVETEVVVIAPDDYPTKVQTAFVGGESEPDIIVAEPQMLGDMFDYGAFADLDQFGAQDYADQIVDYVWQIGQDSDGVQRAISYQITPAGIYYRRDIAQTVFGTDDPDEIGKLFADYPTILQTAQTLKNAGYRIFASDSEMNYFSGDSAWVIDGKLNVSAAREEYMDLVVDLYQGDLTAYANQWSTPWYQAMAGEVPILTADIQNYADDSVNVWDAESFAEATADYEKTEVFAFGLPSWGVITMRDNVGDTAGSWGVCAGPSYGFGGGTFIGISENSNRKELAWDFVKFCTLNEDTAEWWIDYSEGDTVSLISVLEAHKDDENPVYGNEKMYAMWLELAEGIDYSKVTQYDTAIGDAWGAAISSIKTGQMSKEDAINEFYDTVQSTYPDLVIER